MRSCFIWAAGIVIPLCLLTACSQEDVNKMIDQGKQAVDQGTQSVSNAVDQAKTVATESTTKAKETLQLSGKMELASDAPITTSGCYSIWVPAHDSRPAVLQIQSYKEAKTESFPSVYIRSLVSAEKAADLVGQTIDVQIYGQTQSGGPVWFSASETPGKLKILSSDDQQMTCELEQCVLERSDGAASTTLSGKITGIWVAR